MKELTEIELKNCNGGLSVFGINIPVSHPWGVAIAAAIWIYDEWDEIKAGWDSYDPKYIGK